MDEFLDYVIFHIGEYQLKVINLIGLLIFVLALIIISIFVKKIINRSHKIDTNKKFAFYKLYQYIITVIAFLSILRILGFNISVLLAGSAALLVGLGFGLQNLFHDFISGVILLLEGTMKVNDIIEVDGMICKVEEINFRTTTVVGRDDNQVILPNSTLTSNRIINWTHTNASARFKVDIGVDYSTDVTILMPLLVDAIKDNPHVLKNPSPFARFEDYGESSLNFSVYYFSYEIFRSEAVKSDLRVAIYKKIKEAGITIPFPQRVVHIKEKKNG